MRHGVAHMTWTVTKGVMRYGVTHMTCTVTKSRVMTHGVAHMTCTVTKSRGIRQGEEGRRGAPETLTSLTRCATFVALPVRHDGPLSWLYTCPTASFANANERAL